MKIKHRESTYDIDGTWNLTFEKADPNSTIEDLLYDLKFQMYAKSCATRQSLDVLYSGGIDSEVWCNVVRDLSALHPEMPVPKVTSYAFKYGNTVINSHDLAYAYHWHEVNPHIPFEVKNIQLDELWNSSWFWNFVRLYKCTSPQLPVHAYMAFKSVQEGNIPVLSEMQPELKRIEDGRVFFEEKEKDYAVVNALKIAHVPVFESPLQSSSSLMYALLKDLGDFLVRTEQDTAEYKVDQYKRWFGYDLIPRPKFHGFEGYEELDNSVRKAIYQRFKYNDERLWVPYPLLMKNFVLGDTTYSKNTEGVIHYVREGYQPI